jgi:hypothetical protein
MQCEFCKKEFAKEKTLLIHICEQKRRYLGRNERHVKAGLLTYQKFYEVAQKSAKPKTFDDFISSPYYTAFVKFGSFFANTNPIYPERYVDWIIRSGVKLDHWCSDDLYNKYVLELIKQEPADGAVQRSIKTMIEWGDKNNASWEHYFAYVNLNRLAHDIKEGLISPWLVLNIQSGKDALQKMNDDQLSVVGPIIDPQFWKRKFKNYPADVELIKEVITEAKIL